MGITIPLRKGSLRLFLLARGHAGNTNKRFALYKYNQPRNISGAMKSSLHIMFRICSHWYSSGYVLWQS